MISQDANNSKTQNQQIFEHLMKYGSITPLDALNRYGCMRLGARIYDLRKLGYDIVSVQEHKGGKAYARYFLKGERK